MLYLENQKGRTGIISKNIIYGIIILTCAALLFTGAVSAEVYSGSCGSNVQWSLDTSSGVLTISGTGAMSDYSTGTPPWKNYAKYIKAIDIKQGVTAIGDLAFCNSLSLGGSPGITSVRLSIPSSVKNIGFRAFDGCSGLTSLTLPYGVEKLEGYAFRGCGITSVSLPSSIKSLGVGVFAGCTNLKRVTLPSGITAIPEYAFQGCTGITNIYVPSDVTTIGSNAFRGCTGLSAISLPSGLTGIGESAFSGCTGLTSIDIPSTVTSISYYAFSGCTGLTSVEIPTGVKLLKVGVFGGISSNSIIYLLGSTTVSSTAYSSSKTALARKNTDGSYTFTSSLNPLTLNEANAPNSNKKGKWYSSSSSSTQITSVAKDTNPTLWLRSDVKVTSISVSGSNQVTVGSSISLSATVYPTTATNKGVTWKSSNTNVATVNSYGKVTGITQGSVIITATATDGSYVKGTKTVTVVPKTVKVTKITLSGAESIVVGNTSTIYALVEPSDATNKQVTWSSSDTTVATVDSGGLVSGLKEGAVTITAKAKDGSNVKGTKTIEIVQHAYAIIVTNTTGGTASPSVSSATEGTVISLTQSADHGYVFKEWEVISGGITVVNNQFTMPNCDVEVKAVFETTRGIIDSGKCGDNLTWVLTDDGTLTLSGTGAMYDYSDFTSVPWHSYWSQMTKLVLPNGLTTIGEYAFSWCSNFTGSLTIPNSVTSIGDSAFCGCSGFTGSLIIPNNVTTIGYCAFEYCNGFTGSLTIPNSVTTIDSGAFQSCSGFNGALTLPNNLTTIGNFAFSRCSGFIGTLVIPNGITTIGDFAFDGCSNFTGSLTIPNSVTTMGDNPFSYCNNISAITVDSANPNYSSDSQGILYNKNWSSIICCPAGKTGTLTISDSVTTIGDYAFDGCSGLIGSLTIPNNVTTIGYCAFEYCNGFTGSLTIPNSVTTIDSGAFDGCSGFTGSLTIPSSITTIGAHVFSGCSGITTVTLPSSVTSIGYDAFKALHANSVIYAECPASLVSGNYSTDRTALAAKGTDNAYTFTVDVTSFPSGFSLTSDNAPVKENYTFAGWYTTPSYSGSAVSTVTDGQTLYAKWIDGDAGFHLYAGWNVVSTPKKLSSAYDTAAELFADVNMTGHAVLTYDAEIKAWKQVTASTKIEPLNAYWIYSNESKDLPYEFSSTESSPASKSVYTGWNAVSLSADEPMSAAETFGNTNWYTYLEWNAALQAFKSALIKGGSGTHADTNLVSLWTGGWLFLNEDGTYMGFTA